MRRTVLLVLIGLGGGCGERAPSAAPPRLAVSAQPLVQALSGQFDQNDNPEGMVVVSGQKLTRAFPTPSISSWTRGSSLNDARQGQSAAAGNGFAFVTGGTQGGQTLDKIESLDLSQPTGQWDDIGQLPNGGRSQHASVAYNGYLYVLGGQDPKGAVLADVSFAPIRGGYLGPWTQTQPIPGARRGHTAVAYAGYLYVVGGYDAAAATLSDVEIAQFEPDGQLKWLPTPGTRLPAGLGDHACVAYHQHLYVLGGCLSTACSAPQSSIQSASVLPDGTLGAWQLSGQQLTPGRAHFAAVAANGYLYAVGGASQSVPLSQVDELAISASGKISASGTATPLAAPVAGHSLIQSGGMLLVIAGAGQDSDSVSLGSLSSSGVGFGAGVSDWTTLAPDFPNPREGHAQALAGGMAFIFGGEGDAGPLGDAWARPVSQGSLPWADAGQVPVTPSNAPLAGEGASAVGIGNVVYLAGGVGNSGPYDNAVYTASVLTPTGGLSSWQRYPYSAAARTYHGFTAYDGYVYVSGGQICPAGQCTAYSSDLLYAPLTGAGVGSWATVVDAGFTGRAKHCSVAYNGVLYLLGGYDAYGDTDGGTDVLMVPLSYNNVPTQQGHAASMPSEHVSFVCGAADGYLYAFGGGTTFGSTGSASVEYAPIHVDGTVGPWLLANSLPSPRVASAGGLYSGLAILTGGYDTSSTPFTYYADTRVGTLGAPALAGEYSKLIDFGTQVDSVDGFTYFGSGVSEGFRGQVALEFEAAGADGGFLPMRSLGPLPLAAERTVTVPNVRYLWIHLYLLDGSSGVLDPDAGTERDVKDLQIAFTNNPVQLAFVTPPRTVAAGSCSPPVTLQSENDAGFPAPAPAGGALNLNGPGLSFFRDAACTSATSSVPFSGGRWSATFYFTGADAGSYALSAQVGPLSATQDETVTPGAVDGGSSGGGPDGGVPTGPASADLGCGCGASASRAGLAALFALLLVARVRRRERRR